LVLCILTFNSPLFLVPSSGVSFLGRVFFRYRRATGLWLPPAIPSPAMLQESAFVAAALSRSAAFYPAALLRLNPAYALAALPPARAAISWAARHVASVAAVLRRATPGAAATADKADDLAATTATAAKATAAKCAVNTRADAAAAAAADDADDAGRASQKPRECAPLGAGVLWVWVVSWVAGMSALGAWGGAGYQMRFVLPATPALAALAAAGITQ
jgi:hypothetical protein